ncbi:hypothetical protein PTKIN_Ptkin05aG0093800 [Pterospermum kingtungense]
MADGFQGGTQAKYSFEQMVLNDDMARVEGVTPMEKTVASDGNEIEVAVGKDDNLAGDSPADEKGSNSEDEFDRNTRKSKLAVASFVRPLRLAAAGVAAAVEAIKSIRQVKKASGGGFSNVVFACEGWEWDDPNDEFIKEADAGGSNR